MAGSFLQSPFWGRYKEKQGWRALFFSVDTGKCSFPLLILTRRLLRILPIAYIPHGPALINRSIPDDPIHLLRALAAGLQGELPLGTLFIRFDPPWEIDEKLQNGMKQGLDWRRGWWRSAQPIQPRETTILTLRRDGAALDDQTLMSTMHKKCRYNIKLAGRRGVQIRRISDRAESDAISAAISSWYALYETTARRDRITIHRKEYYHNLFRLAAKRRENGVESDNEPEFNIWLARHEAHQQPLAGIITVCYNHEAIYLYGASGDHGRALMPNHLLQWEAIRYHRDRGISAYDFFGIPPQEEDTDHPLSGLFRFKTGFGGAIIRRPGAWDYPYGKWLYLLFRLTEWLRSRYYRYWRKRRHAS